MAFFFPFLLLNYQNIASIYPELIPLTRKNALLLKEITFLEAGELCHKDPFNLE